MPLQTPSSIDSILIADSDPRFLEGLKGELKDSGPQGTPQPLFAKCGREAQSALGDQKNSFTAAFIHKDISDPDARSVIHFCHLNRPALPIFLLADQNPGPITDEMKRHGVRECLVKPLTLAQLIRHSPVTLSRFDPEAALRESRNDRATAETKSNPEAYFSIRPDPLMAGSVSYFDLFIRLSSHHFIKVVAAGDEFSRENFTKYIKKGVSEFFIRLTMRDHYLAFQNTLASAALKSEGASLTVKMTATLAQGQNTMNFLQSRGLSDKEVQLANQFIANTRSLVDQMDLSKVGDLSSFLTNMAGMEHGVSTSMIASLLAKELGFDAEKTVKIVGIASLFHDVGLYKLFPGVVTPPEDVSKMSPSEKTLYYSHPQVSAKILAEAPGGADEVITQAITLHHQRRHKQGFPARERGSSLNRVAEIVGISDEFAMLIQRASLNPEINLKEEMEFGISHGFSLQVSKAFQKVFFAESK